MKYVIGNWKMKVGIRESVALAKATLLTLRGQTRIPELVVCPSFVALADVRKTVARSHVRLGAQNVCSQATGAFTGEVSVSSLKEVGCEYVLVGHSERRTYGHETLEEITQKVELVLQERLVPIVCVGESHQEDDEVQTQAVILQELEAIFADVTLHPTQRVLVAYEPRWAIGTGRSPAVSTVVAIHASIRAWLTAHFPAHPQTLFSVCYGGSVTEENTYQLLREKEVDGVLVGGESVKLASFGAIIQHAIRVLEAQSL